MLAKRSTDKPARTQLGSRPGVQSPSLLVNPGHGPVDADQPVARITHQQIADHIGSSRPAVSRMLTQFRHDGLISTGRRAILLRDAEAMADRIVTLYQ